MPGEKTEKATPKRRKEQRKEGNVVQSQDIVGAVVLLCIFGTFRAMGREYLNQIASGMVHFFGGLNTDLSGGGMQHQYLFVLSVCAGVLLPIFLINIFVSVAGTMAQTKLLFVPGAAKFKFSKLNPISGFKNLFSPKSFVEIIKSIVKIAIIGYIMYTEISSQLPHIYTLYQTNISVSIAWAAQLILDICFKGTIAFLIIGVVDYFYQWWDYERRIRMSKEDLKEEFKQTEGNPEIKGRIKNEQMRLARSRQMQAVPTADVVIRNPTHFAIALKYEKGKSKAPVVVAKGQNNVALKIVEIAAASRVHIVENIPLARALYKAVDVGDEIPEEFYKAVAEVLAYIYRLKRAGRS